MTEDQKDEIRALIREVLAETPAPRARFGVAGPLRGNAHAVLADAEQRRGDVK